MTMRVKPARGLVRWFLKTTGYRGITIPPVGIYILSDSMGDRRLIRHEEAHWAQYSRLGFWKFYGLYSWYWLRYGYESNPLEVEARAAENG